MNESLLQDPTEFESSYDEIGTRVDWIDCLSYKQ